MLRIDTMKTIYKEVLAGVIVLIIGGVGTAFLAHLTNFFTTILDIPPLPLPFVVLVSFLATYPILVFIKFLLTIRATPPFMHGGLLWKSSWWPLEYPMPICSTEGCGLDLIDETTTYSPYAEIPTSYHFICAKHGSINVTKPPARLQEEAKIIRKKLRDEQKKKQRITWFRKSA
jgi:hypothetical protein